MTKHIVGEYGELKLKEKYMELIITNKKLAKEYELEVNSTYYLPTDQFSKWSELLVVYKTENEGITMGNWKEEG